MGGGSACRGRPPPRRYRTGVPPRARPPRRRRIPRPDGLQEKGQERQGSNSESRAGGALVPDATAGRRRASDLLRLGLLLAARRCPGLDRTRTSPDLLLEFFVQE